MISNRRLAILFFASLVVVPSDGFSAALFQEQATKQVTAPVKQTGVEIELPDFDELFSRIRQTSPMAKLVLDHAGEIDGKRGLNALEHVGDDMKWKRVENNKNRLVQRIEKIDNFQGLPAPLLRFRCSLKGPCLAHIFGNFLTTKEFRSKWDESLDEVFEAYPIEDLDTVNLAMGQGEYGDCTKIGVGYCTTKPKFGVDSREQLTMCGIQEMKDGACIIWGTEMEDWHNHLLPDDYRRRTRARSHIFSTTLIPTGKDSFDVEYVIQLEIGGNLPTWITTPIVIDNVKNMFKVVDAYFGEGEGGALDQYLKGIQKEAIDDHSLLMTP